jgi:hypothetical protein
VNFKNKCNKNAKHDPNYDHDKRKGIDSGPVVTNYCTKHVGCVVPVIDDHQRKQRDHTRTKIVKIHQIIQRGNTGIVNLR